MNNKNSPPRLQKQKTAFSTRAVATGKINVSSIEKNNVPCINTNYLIKQTTAFDHVPSFSCQYFLLNNFFL